SRPHLVDDLWALGLAHLRELPAHDRQAAESIELMGRNLDPWRPILAVAHWLQEQHDVLGLFARMKKLASTYQLERAEFEEADKTRVLFRALLQLSEGWPGAASHNVQPKDVAEAMNAIAKAEDLTDSDKAFTTARRVGWLLKRQRFRRPDTKDERARL